MTDVRMWIAVTPRSTRSGVVGQRADSLLVKVRSAATDGRATEEALALLAEHLGVRRRDIVLVTGATSRRKLVAITDAPDAVRLLAAALAEQSSSEPTAT